MTAVDEDSLPTEGKPQKIPMAAPAPPSSSPMKLGEVPQGSESRVDDMDLKTYVKHLSLWNQPMLTLKYVGTMLTLFYFTMEGRFTIVGFLCLAIFLRVVLVAVLHMAGEQLKGVEGYGAVQKIGELLMRTGTFVKDQTKMPSPSSVNYWVTGIAEHLEAHINCTAKAIDQAESDPKMLKVVLGQIVGVIIVFSIVSFRTLLFVSLFLLFTAAPVYSREYKRIDPMIASIQDKLKPHMKKLEDKGKEIAGVVSAKLSDAQDKMKAKVQELKDKRAAKSGSGPAAVKKNN